MYTLILLIIKKLVELQLLYPLSASRPSRMDCSDGRSTSIISFEFIQYLQLLLIREHRMYNHLM